MKIYYALPDIEYSIREMTISGEWCIHRPIEQSQLAEKCAENYFHFHNEYDRKWPQTVALYESKAGPEIARFQVVMETEPVFFAEKRKEYNTNENKIKD